jgi:hypothetical protein
LFGRLALGSIEAAAKLLTKDERRRIACAHDSTVTL